MSQEAAGPGEGVGIYQALPNQDPAARRATLLRHIQEHPEQRLELPASNGLRAMLDDVDLGRDTMPSAPAEDGTPPPWWNPEHGTTDLRRADLRGASLRRANLQGVRLEQGQFGGADLAGVNFRGAILSEADFTGAMLEEANLQGASLRFACLKESVAEGARLQRADLWGAQCMGADLVGANLEGAILEEANLERVDLRRANLRGAVLRRASLRGANLEGADLQGATLTGADLEGAFLREARLQELDLSHCRLTHVHLSDAWLDRTRLRDDQLDGVIGEELAGEYELARRGYLALERNFEVLGDPDAAGWAYRRKRRMQKRDNLRRATVAWGEGRPLLVARYGLRYAGDQLVEWVCDYGESIPRVLMSLVAAYLIFLALYAATGTVARVVPEDAGSVKVSTRAVGDVALFSLTAMTAPGNPPPYLAPANEVGYVLASVQALVSIFLTGLLGFVAGNRIRR